MKKVIFYFLVGATTVASVLSCRQDVGEVVPSVKIISDGVSLRNGRIAFETLDDFKKTIEGLKAMSESQRKEWDAKVGHSSMQNLYDNVEGMVDGVVNPVYRTKQGDYPYIADILFARIVNTEGLFQLGNVVHCIKMKGKELTTEEKNAALLLTNPVHSTIKSHDISVILEGADANSTKANAKVGGYEYPLVGYDFGNNRVAGAVFSKSTFFMYQSYAMKLQMRRLGGWWIFTSWQAENAESLNISLAGFGAYSVGSGNFYGGSGSGSCSNCSDAYAFLAEFYGPIILDVVNVGGNFQVNYGGQQVNFSR